MKLRRKVIALLMSLTMVLTYMPGLAFATDGTEAAQPNEVVQTDDTGLETDSDVVTDDADESGDSDLPEQSQTAQTEQSIDQIESPEVVSYEEQVTTELDMATAGGDSKVVKPDVDVADSDDLLMDYFNKEVAGDLGSDAAKSTLRKAPNKTRRANLGEIEGNIYDVLLSEIDAMISNVESGQAIEAVFTIDPEKMLGKTFSKSTINTVDGPVEIYNVPSEDFDAFQSFDSSAILNALLFDQPYKLFWFDKTKGIETKMPQVSYYNLDGGSVKGFEELPVNEFYFYVSSDYSASGDAGTYELDSTKLARVNLAADYAADIIANAASQGSPVDILNYFRTEICRMTDYDRVAADTNQAYGDPWQMINVFDNDAATKVVCEGYSKAFQYLCDNCGVLSDAGIECDSVTGTMTGGTGAGAHMWNVLHMNNGLNYIADITNCDADNETGSPSVGYPDRLFLTGCMAGGSVENGYEYDCDGDGIADIHYSYTSTYLDGDGVEQTDATTIDTFAYDDLVMSETAYEDSTQPVEPEQPSEVESIAYISADGSNSFEVYEGESAYITDDGAGEYMYYYPPFKSGDVITVNYTNGESSDYNYISGEGFFYNFTNYTFLDFGYSCDQSFSNQWTPDGSGYYFILTSENKSCTIPFTFKAKDDTFESFEFLRGESPNTIDQYTGVDTVNTNRYYIHFKDGDQLIFRTETGAETVYSYHEDEDEVISFFENVDDPSDTIQDSDVSIRYNIGEEWPQGTSHNVELWYHGHKADITVNIVENPIKGITYKNSKGDNYLQLIEGVDGYYDSEIGYEYYELPDFDDGDQLIIDINGTLETYTYAHDYNDEYQYIRGFMHRNSDGEVDEIITLADFQWDSNQSSSNQWAVEDTSADNHFDMQFNGVSFQIPVKIVANPVKSISFTPSFSTTIYENTGGGYCTEDDVEYYEYDFPGFCDGDILTVVKTEGGADVTSVYELQYDEDEERDLFVNQKNPDDRLDVYNGRYCVDTESDQYYDDPWGVGPHTFTVNYMGHSADVNVEIKANPVNGVSFMRPGEEPIVLTKGIDSVYDEVLDCNKYLLRFKVGDVITLEDKDGNSFRYLAEEDNYGDIIFVKENTADTTMPDTLSEGNEIRLDSDQYDPASEEWAVGSDHVITLDCMGQTTTINVTIAEGSGAEARVESISFNRPSLPEGKNIELIKNVDGFVYEGKFWYNLHFEEGDQVIFRYTDGSTATYIDTKIDDIDTFINSTDPDDKLVLGPDIELYLNQIDKDWDVGDHEFILRYLGDEYQPSCAIPVTIVSDSEAEAVPAKAATCTEGGYAEHWKKDGRLYKDAACTVETTLAELATEALGHDWDEGTVTTEATCTTEGVRTFHCSRCTETRTEEIPINSDAHAWGEWHVAVPATCSTTGTEQRECGHNPTHVETREIPINPDAHIPGEPVIENRVEAACEEDGHYDEVVYCTACNEELSRETKTIPALGHDWDEGTVTKEPTESEEGIMTYTCKRCGETSTETIPVLEHTHVMTHVPAVAPTCVNDGTIEYWECGKCHKLFSDAEGKNEITEVVDPAKGHTPGEMEIENYVEPTYSQPGGSDEVIRCMVCGEIISSEHRTFKPLRENAQESLATAETSNANAEAAEGSTDVMPSKIAEVDAENALIDANMAEESAQKELDELTKEGSTATPEEITAAKSNLAEAKEAVAKACTALAAAKKSAAKVAANRAASAQAAAQSAPTSAIAEAYRQQAVAEAANAQRYAQDSQTAASNAAAKADEIAEIGEEFNDVAAETKTIADNAGAAAATASGSSSAAAGSAAAAQSAVVSKAEAESLAAAEAARQAEIAANNGIIDPTLPKVSIKAPKKAKKAFTAKWKKLSKKNQKKVKGIEYEYSTDPYFTTGNVFKTAKKTSTGGKKIKGPSKTTYYVRAHTYVIRDGIKYVSPWSKTKKVKTK